MCVCVLGVGKEHHYPLGSSFGGCKCLGQPRAAAAVSANEGPGGDRELPRVPEAAKQVRFGDAWNRKPKEERRRVVQ